MDVTYSVRFTGPGADLMPGVDVWDCLAIGDFGEPGCPFGVVGFW
jgi:hypothetical protein